MNETNIVIQMKTMKIWRNIFVMCAALLSLASCHQSKQGTKVGLQSDSIEVATNADTLLVIIGKDSAASDSEEPIRLKLPLDSVVIEMVNNTDITCVTGYGPTCTTSSKAEHIASARNILCLAKKAQALPIAISQQTKVHNENKWIFPSHHRATVTDYRSYLRQTVRMDA